MLAYLASEDPAKITREQIDAAAVMAQQAARGGRRGRRRWRGARERIAGRVRVAEVHAGATQDGAAVEVVQK
jgi:hypothetical protein